MTAQPTRRNTLGLMIGVMTATLGPLGGAARAETAQTATQDGIALAGYDAVAYFTQGRAVKGSRDHALRWRGAVWYFATSQTMEEFEMNPMGFAPQYGGYCAYAATMGTLGEADPKVFAIIEGRLFLNATPSTQAHWQQDLAGNIAAADGNWPGLIGR